MRYAEHGMIAGIISRDEDTIDELPDKLQSILDKTNPKRAASQPLASSLTINLARPRRDQRLLSIWRFVPLALGQGTVVASRDAIKL